MGEDIGVLCIGVAPGKQSELGVRALGNWGIGAGKKDRKLGRD